MFALVSLLYWALDMSNKTYFSCYSLPNAIELPRRGEGEKTLSFLPLVCATHGSRKNWNTHPDRQLKGGNFCFNFCVISSPFYLHSVGVDNKIVACSGPFSHLRGEDYCRKSLFLVFVCHKCAAFQLKARTQQNNFFSAIFLFKKINRVHI